MIHKILAIIIASLSTVHTYSGSSINNLNAENNIAPEIVKINQSYFIDGIEIYDSSKLITESNGKACLQIPGEDGWEDKFDLLSNETDLPTDRTQPKIYTIEFETPVYSFRFYSEYYGTDYVSGSNRGRICIGDMRLQFQRSDYMSLNWSELEYEPSKWNDSNVEEYNCYAYALNTKNHWFMHPSQSEGHKNSNTNNYLSKDILVDMVGLDASNYNFDFKPIGKYEPCYSGYYKVALVVAPRVDYHWYRQNQEGTWSHKSGINPVTNVDGLNDLIYDPETCNRIYFWASYTEFYGFYQVNIQTMM